MNLHSMKIKEYKGDVVFLHEVINGAADRSYGIHVAKIVGLPKLVVTRAEQVLDSLENSDKSTYITKMIDDLPLFATVQKKVEEFEIKDKKSALHKAVESINPDDLTPKEALEKLYQIKNVL